MSANIGVFHVKQLSSETFIMENRTEEKKEVRRAALAARDAIPAHERSARSQAACAQIERLLVERFSQRSAEPPLVAVYFAMKSEVDLAELVRACFAREWEVCFPCMMKEPQPLPMEFYSVTPSQLLACDSFPCNPLRRFAPEELERLGFHHVLPHDIDAITVPMTAFDSQGNRLGYGGGNYDRYLPLLREDTAIIGAAFSEQQVEAVPTSPHDLPLPLIVKA